jgi:protein-L-isoaspartate O-methyltransferase
MAEPSRALDPVDEETARRRSQGAAEGWHRWSPTLGQWLGAATELMLDLAAVGAGSRVLDLAAGAGEQTLAAARRVGPTGYVLATETDDRLLAYAERSARRAGLSNVETRVTDGRSLGAAEASFDAAVSRLGLTSLADRDGALAAMRRALRPGGRIGAIVCSVPEANRVFSLPLAIVERRAGRRAAPGSPGPFDLGGPGALEDALIGAGFRDVRTRLIAAPLRMRSAGECLRFERESFPALEQTLVGLPEAEREAAWVEVGEVLRQFEGPSGFTGPCEVLVGTGTT